MMRNKIIIADDMKLNRTVLSEILRDEYITIEAEDGVIALQKIEENKEELAAILLDLVMPNMDGFQVLTELKKNGMIKNVPVLVISSEQEEHVEKKCFQYGVIDFVRKPFDNELIQMRIRNIVEMYVYRDDFENKMRQSQEQLRKQYQQLVIQAKQLKKQNEDTIRILGVLVESRGLTDSGEHATRLQKIVRIFAAQVLNDYPDIGLDEKKVDDIAITCVLHDLGKIQIPDSILFKKGKLLENEEAFLRSHTLRGAELVHKINDRWDQRLIDITYNICRWHHERYDGTGYPDKLAGDHIPLEAQIVSIADEYETLLSDDNTGAAVPASTAFKMIVTGERGMFNPRLIESFRNARSEIEKVL